MIKLSSRFGAAKLLLPLVLGTFASVSSLAPRAAHAQAVSMGVVDEDKLAEGYKKYKTAIEVIDKRAQDLDGQIPAREYLSDAEGKQFDTLIVKTSPTAKENTDLQGIIKIGLDKRAVFMGLIGKSNRTAEETVQMKALQDQAARNTPALRGTSDALLAAIRTQQDETDKLYTDRANSVIAQVAGDKKFALVVRKKALVWSLPTIDITEEVLKRLNAA